MKTIDFYQDNKFINLIQSLHSKASLNTILEFMFKGLCQHLPYNRIGIAILDEDKETISNRKVISEDAVCYQAYEVPLHQTAWAYVIETGLPRIVNNLEVYRDKNPDSLWARCLLEEGIHSNLMLPLRLREENVGVIFFSHRQPNIYSEEHLEFLRFLAPHISIVFEKSFLMRKLALTTVMGLADLAEKRDLETGQHLKRLKYYSRALAIELDSHSIYGDQIDEEFIQDIYDFSSLHDIGKVGISDSILRKPGKLTSEEFQAMTKHTVIGGEILEAIEDNLRTHGFSFFKMGIEIVYYHQEKFDGSGYPSGLRAEAIPLSARIVSVCDVFDACSLRRVYKEAYSFEKSYRIIEEGKVSHFDPVIVDAFMNIKGKIEKIYNRFRD
jgi:response regulator RpfG family c-di-GMP phosphodiesterase